MADLFNPEPEKTSDGVAEAIAALSRSFPWLVKVDKTQVDESDPAEVFISRTVEGTNMGGGTEVAIVTTGSYDDEQEARHAALLGAAPVLFQAVVLSTRMRQLQRAYFKTRDRGVLVASKQIEAELDALLELAINRVLNPE